MNLEEKISGNEAAVEPELYFNELTDPSHRAQFEYLIKESKSYISHAVNVSELRLTKLGAGGRREKLLQTNVRVLRLLGSQVLRVF